MKKITKASMTIAGTVVFMTVIFSTSQGGTKPATTQTRPVTQPMLQAKPPALPDLVPVGNPAVPSSFCVLDNQGRLVVKIKNQGQADAPASTTKVIFANHAPILLPTAPIKQNSAVALPAREVPKNCFGPSDCSFTITADANNQAVEADENNNSARGACRSKLPVQATERQSEIFRQPEAQKPPVAKGLRNLPVQKPSAKSSSSAQTAATPGGPGINALASQPDLKINKVWLGLYGKSPDTYVPVPENTVIPGKKVYLICEFLNIGADLPGYPSRPSFSVGYYIDGVLKYSSEIWAYMPNGKILLPVMEYIPGSQEQGPHSYKCVLDYENSISEQREDNNEGGGSFTVAAGGSYPGTKLRITRFNIDDATGSVWAAAENFGDPMTTDAKLVIFFDSTRIRECLWRKSEKQISCGRNAFRPEDPPALRSCDWGKRDLEVRAEIEGGGYSVDDSGRYKRGILHARQDLAVEGFTKNQRNCIGVIISNRGSCSSTTWSYKVYDNDQLILTPRYPAGSIKPGTFTTDFFSDMRTPCYHHANALRVEVIPANPEFELRSDNNSYSSSDNNWGRSYNPDVADLTVRDIKFKGEILAPPYGDPYFELVPVIMNIGPARSVPRLAFEFFIDGVSQGEKECFQASFGVQEKNETAVLSLCESKLPVLPEGRHTVKIKIKCPGDPDQGNNSFAKTMVKAFPGVEQRNLPTRALEPIPK